MDNLERLKYQTRLYLFGLVIAEGLVILMVYGGLTSFVGISELPAAAIALLAGVFAAWIVARIATDLITRPIQVLWQTILHVSPADHGIAAPDTTNLRIGQELVTSLSAQIHQLASVIDQTSVKAREEAHDLSRNFIAQNLPLPLLILGTDETVKFANDAAATYINQATNDIIGKNIYSVLDMSFPSEDTFDSWLKTVKTKKATDIFSWERVRLNAREDRPVRLFDLAAYYNQDNPDGNATILVLFDHTKQYSQDDQAISFMALSVHELRTPLTLLRGYIEVFEDEIGHNVKDPELQSFMEKMRAMADQLTAFVNNILNVARIDDDQLELELQSENWPTVLKSAIEMMSLRAKVRDIKLECHIATELPPVGIDRLSIREVISNLIDNAIKYSGTSQTVKIDTYLNKDGLVETTVQDFGVGIPASAIPNLFSKFYRDHHNRSQIGGTGLGLYLSKAIIDAHGGNLWVRSKENEGSTFGFTLMPYAQLAEEKKGNQEITRGAHGWIKNHSLYRR